MKFSRIKCIRYNSQFVVRKLRMSQKSCIWINVMYRTVEEVRTFFGSRYLLARGEGCNSKTFRYHHLYGTVLKTETLERKRNQIELNRRAATLFQVQIISDLKAAPKSESLTKLARFVMMAIHSLLWRGAFRISTVTQYLISKRVQWLTSNKMDQKL